MNGAPLPWREIGEYNSRSNETEKSKPCVWNPYSSRTKMRARALEEPQEYLGSPPSVPPREANRAESAPLGLPPLAVRSLNGLREPSEYECGIKGGRIKVSFIPRDRTCFPATASHHRPCSFRVDQSNMILPQLLAVSHRYAVLRGSRVHTCLTGFLDSAVSSLQA
ncbi:hypothetical protein FA13DRAFT_1739479 [Coprinellus micaceus]|uniref:Uncharacterized protein n=1 Tax=Coprinellus micaceus TaxID=71717 RepID=A0A4Y7SQX8_COPMI|nr:hypothetical protein FA13DRAFT_1739479 [Coprinellus micaceus]